jgi:hypothetical protein
MGGSPELGQIWRERHPSRLVKITHIWPNSWVTIRACDENGNFTRGSEYIVREQFEGTLVWPVKEPS